jgi:hypothetical protein
MLRRVALVRTDIMEEPIASIIRVSGIDELGTLAVSSTQSTLQRNASSETSGLTLSTKRNISEDGILHSYSRENLKSYITGWALEHRYSMFPVRYELALYIPEDGVLYSHRRDNLKYYIPVLFLNFDVSETGLYLRLQVEPTELVSINGATLSPETVETNCIGTQLSRFHPMMETETRSRYVMLQIKYRTIVYVRNHGSYKLLSGQR